MSASQPRRRFRLAALLALLPLLAGCGGLLPSPPERQIYRLAPRFTFAAPLPHVAAQLLVTTPNAQPGLDTRRIALSRTPLSLDYFAGVEWGDRAPFVVQGALLAGFEKSGAIAAVGPETAGVRADLVLDTSIGDFEAVYDSPHGPPHVRVSLVARLVRMPDRSILARTAVTRDAPASANTVPAVVAAFDRALGGATDNLVDWTLTRLGKPALPRHRRSATSRTRFVHGARRTTG
jgi:cholesterol transport system auxiliary component